MAADIFVDTSGWFPLVDPEDRAHAAVAQAMRSAITTRRRIVTSNLVVAETHALIMRRINRVAALAFLREVVRAPTLVISSTPELEIAATGDWLERYDDQEFSLTDAVSFAIMKERGIRDALAVDHHFAAAGFAILPGAKR